MGGAFNLTFASGGFDAYHRDIHPEMHGMVVVAGA